jgi:hypothetical protein
MCILYMLICEYISDPNKDSLFWKISGDNPQYSWNTQYLGPKNGGFLEKYRGDALRTSSYMKAYPQKPPCGHQVLAPMAMVLPSKIVEDFQSFVKNIKL